MQAIAARGQCAGQKIDVADEVGHKAVFRPFRRYRSGAPICRMLPSCMTAMRSDMVRASSWSWVTKMKVMPSIALQPLQFDLHFLAQLRVERRERARRAAARSAVAPRARAKATRCCWPPESWAGAPLREMRHLHQSQALHGYARSSSATGQPLHLEAEGDVLLQRVICGNRA